MKSNTRICSLGIRCKSPNEKHWEHFIHAPKKIRQCLETDRAILRVNEAAKKILGEYVPKKK